MTSNKASDAISKDQRISVVVCTILPIGYQIIREWASQTSYNLSLIITTPGPSKQRNTSYQDIVAMASPDEEIIVTRHMKRLIPLLAAISPDLIISFSFPIRIPREIFTIPVFGAVNLHPSLLPLYRGPNPARIIFDGQPTIGATLHRIEEDFDSGPILSQHELPMPIDATLTNILHAWSTTWVSVLHEGVDRALAGVQGIPQDHACASYASPFTEEECWIDWHLNRMTIQRRVTALNLAMTRAVAIVDNDVRTLVRVALVEDSVQGYMPGSILSTHIDGVTIAAADGAVRVFMV